MLVATQAVLAPAQLPPAPATPSPVKWQSVSAAASTSDSAILTINLPSNSGLSRQVAWHRRGDYLATVGEFNTKETLHMALIHRSPSERRRPGRCLDPPDLTETLASTIQKGQGRCPVRLVPPHQASLFRGCKLSLLSPHCMLLTSLPTDPTLCPDLQPCRAKATQNAAAWY